MAKRSEFQERMFALDMPYRKKKRTRVEELRELISESAEERGLEDRRGKIKRFMVTFDKEKNSNFDYWLFDEILIHISHGVGGSGIRKPMHQLRIMDYRKNAKHLLSNIRYYCGHYPNLNMDRALVMLVGDNAGYRLIRGVYRK